MKSLNNAAFDVKSNLSWLLSSDPSEMYLTVKALNFDMSLCPDDHLLKSDRPGHLYIRKYEKGNKTVYVYNRDGKEIHRYDDAGAFSTLLDIGRHLDQIDNVQEQNSIGFNKIDKNRWSMLIHSLGDVDNEQTRKKVVGIMRSILRKYKRQIHNTFGEEEYEHSGLSDRTMHIVEPNRHPRWKTIQLPLKSDGRLGKEAFNKYLEINRSMGLKGARDENGGFVWIVPKELEATFDWAKYEQRLSEIGIHMGEVPEPEQESRPEPASSGAPAGASAGAPVAPVRAPAPELNVDQAIEMIQHRRLPNTLAIKRDTDGKFSFFHQYDGEVVNFFSNRGGEISGIMEYNPNNKSRETYELDLVKETIEKFKTKFPAWKIITGGVDEAIREDEMNQAELRKPIPHVAAKLNPEYKLFPYQNEAVRFLEAANGNALIGDEMGLGKTLQSLAYVAGNNKRVLVVVPKVVRRTWVQEAEKFFPDYFKGRSKELVPAELRKHGMPDLTGVNIATINYESLEKFRPAIEAAGFDTIIVDESHRIKSPTAKITKTISEMANKFAHKILLSGTAVKNKKEELHTQMQIIKPNLFSLGELKRGTIGGVWNKLKRAGVYISRQKRKVLTDLPEKTTQIAEVPVTGMPAFPRDIGEMSAAKVQAALAKVPATHEFVQEILDSSDSSVLIFTESVEAAQKLKEEFGDVAILHHGQMSDERREQAKAEFQNPDSPKRVFISTRQSLAVGATLTRADKVVFNDLPWTAADVRQAEDRAHRVGQRNNVNVYWITAQDNEWDTNMAAIVKKKYELNRKLNEGKQLTKEEREWMEKPVSLEDIRAEITGRSQMADQATKSYSISDLFKAIKGQSVAGHKYIRKYMANGSWVYVYHEDHTRRHEIDSGKLELIKKLADLGDKDAKELVGHLESAQAASSKDEAHAPETLHSKKSSDGESEARVFRNSQGFGAGLYDVETGNRVGGLHFFDTMEEAKAKAESLLPRARPQEMTFKEPEREGSKTSSVDVILSSSMSGWNAKLSSEPYQSPSTSTCNLVGYVAFGKASKKAQKQLNTKLQQCELVLSEMGVRMKRPIDFVCQRMDDAEFGTMAAFASLPSYRLNSRINIMKRAHTAAKSLMHEIGHGIDYAMSDLEGGNDAGRMWMAHGRRQVRNNQIENDAAFNELYDVVTNSKFYEQPNKEDFADEEMFRAVKRNLESYLKKPTEVFARAFEVHAYAVAKKMVDEGKLDKSFLEGFKPDIFKTRNERIREVVREIKDSREKIRELERRAGEISKQISDEIKANNPSSTLSWRMQTMAEDQRYIDIKQALSEEVARHNSLASSVSTMAETGDDSTVGIFVLIPESEQKEYMDKISRIMSKIIQTNEFKKAVEMFFIKADLISGGKADKKKPSDFDRKKLDQGIKVEMEHTSSKQIAQEIAMDHLQEDPNYYIKLKEVEKGVEPTLGAKQGRVPVMRDHEGKPSGKPAPSAPASTLSMHKGEKPFHGYNKKRHSPTGGLNAKFRAKYNREHGSNLQAPVTEKKPTGKRAARRRSFCARMSGVKGPTSKDGKLTPKGAALKRWRCSETYIIDLAKSMLGQSAGSHKYLRKYMRNGQWIYIYHEAGQHGRAIPEAVVQHIKSLAEAGDERAKALHDSLQAHNEEKLKVLRQLADRGDQTSHEHLKSLGIDREKERIEEALLRRKDKIDKEMDAESIQKAKTSIGKEVEDAVRHLGQYQDSPIGQAIFSTLSNPELMGEVSRAKTLRQFMDALEGIARKLEEKQGSISAQRPADHLTYGNMIYNKSLNRLVSDGVISRDYADEHKREARSTTHQTQEMEGIEERAATRRREQEERERRERAEREERERRERAEREERERRELASVHGSLAHHISSLMQTPLSTSQILKLHRTMTTIFGRDMRKEDWPYDFSAQGLKVKIQAMHFSEEHVVFDSIQVYDPSGNAMMDGWTRTWNIRDGRPHIHNDYMKVNPDSRGTIQIGNLINQGQRRLMRSMPNGGLVTVLAAIDVGGYNWANQGFSFDSNSTLQAYREAFQSFARSKGIDLSDEDMKKFKAPVHFAAFRDGKKYMKELEKPIKLNPEQIESRSLSGVTGEYPLTEEEIRSRKSTRMICHLGKAFMLGRSWYGHWDSKKDNRPEARYAEAYSQVRERAVENLEPEYRALIDRAVSGESAPRPSAPATPATPATAPPTTPPTDAPAYARHYLRMWGGRGTIRMTPQRMNRMRRIPLADATYFARYAPISLAARRQINEIVAERRRLGES